MEDIGYLMIRSSRYVSVMLGNSLRRDQCWVSVFVKRIVLKGIGGDAGTIIICDPFLWMPWLSFTLWWWCSYFRNNQPNTYADATNCNIWYWPSYSTDCLIFQNNGKWEYNFNRTTSCVPDEWVWQLYSLSDLNLDVRHLHIIWMKAMAKCRTHIPWTDHRRIYSIEFTLSRPIRNN